MFLICAVFWSFAFVLFFCELGQRVTNAFEEVHDTIAEFQWYAFPLKIQQLLPVMLNVTKQQVHIESFGNCLCIRETFKRVSMENSVV